VKDDPLTRAGLTHHVVLPNDRIISRSESQTAHAVQGVRYRAPAMTEHLTDDDVVWLVGRGWWP
jgi:hypothetical protein